MVAESGDEVGGKRDGIAVFEQDREPLTELDDKAGAELARELDFSKVTESEVQEVQDKLNNRPRKCLGWHTPNEIISNQAAVVALPS